MGQRGHGELIDGRFELLERLGGGGMGLVWRARDTMLHREVALKEVRPPEDAQEGERQLRERVLREARALAGVQHPSCRDEAVCRCEALVSVRSREGDYLGGATRRLRRPSRGCDAVDSGAVCIRIVRGLVASAVCSQSNANSFSSSASGSACSRALSKGARFSWMIANQTV